MKVIVLVSCKRMTFPFAEKSHISFNPFSILVKTEYSRSWATAMFTDLPSKCCCYHWISNKFDLIAHVCVYIRLGLKCFGTGWNCLLDEPSSPSGSCVIYRLIQKHWSGSVTSVNSKTWWISTCEKHMWHHRRVFDQYSIKKLDIISLDIYFPGFKF